MMSAKNSVSPKKPSLLGGGANYNLLKVNKEFENF